MIMSVGKQGRAPRLRHIPGLDGVRAIAVLAVIGFHSGISWLSGGYYGVDAFFVLSGYLITSLLVREWTETGSIGLLRFWGRRARRLLPALYLLITVIGIVAALWPSVLGSPELLGSAIATLFYSANWYFVSAHVNYFAASAAPSPLLHTWSLAIEEQFYLIWPVVVLGVLGVLGSKRRSRGGLEQKGSLAQTKLDSAHTKDSRLKKRSYLEPEEAIPLAIGIEGSSDTLTIFCNRSPNTTSSVGQVGRSREVGRSGRLTWLPRVARLERLFVIAVVGALGSAVLMAVLTPSGANTDLAYYGTDTRAQGLLIGAALAVFFIRWGTSCSVLAKRVVAWIGTLGLIATILIWKFIPETSIIAFHGGFLLAGLATAGIVASAVVTPEGISTRILSIWPLRAIGRISYGVYLWYWPVLLVMTSSRVHLSGYPLFVLQVITTLSLATISYTVLERPILRGFIRNWKALIATPIAAGIAAASVALAVLLPGVAIASPSSLSVSSGIGGSVSQSHLGGSSTNVSSPASRPIKVLLVGDSLAGSLGVGLGLESSKYGVQLVNEGSPGCSISMDQQIHVLWYTLAPGKPCVSGDPNALFKKWKSWVDTYNPDVVVYLARGELYNQEVNGQWTNITDPNFDAYLSKRFTQAIQVLGSRGAAVVMLNSPYSDSGLQPNGQPWPEDLPNRVTIDNRLISQAVAKAEASIRNRALTKAKSNSSSLRASSVSVFNLNALISPHNRYSLVVDGVDMRCRDGVHFTAPGGKWIGQRLLPELVSLGQQHQRLSPSGEWSTSGVTVPSTPSWWYQLPCST